MKTTLGWHDIKCRDAAEIKVIILFARFLIHLLFNSAFDFETLESQSELAGWTQIMPEPLIDHDKSSEEGSVTCNLFKSESLLLLLFALGSVALFFPVVNFSPIGHPLWQDWPLGMISSWLSRTPTSPSPSSAGLSAWTRSPICSLSPPWLSPSCTSTAVVVILVVGSASSPPPRKLTMRLATCALTWFSDAFASLESTQYLCQWVGSNSVEVSRKSVESR